MILFNFQGEVKDIYRFVSFYVYLSLVIPLLILSIPSDVRAFNNTQLLSEYDERRPLLGGNKGYGKKHVQKKKKVSQYLLCSLPQGF